MNRGAITSGRHANSVTSAAKSNISASTLDEMVHGDRHAGYSHDQTRNMSKRTDSPVIKISRKELRFLIDVKVGSTVETAQRKEKKSMSTNLVQETVCNVITKGYCAGTYGFKGSSFLFVEKLVTEMIHRGLLNEKPSQSFERWSQWDAFVQALIEKIVSAQDFIAPIAAFVKQHVINAVEEKPNREYSVPRDIP